MCGGILGEQVKNVLKSVSLNIFEKWVTEMCADISL